MADPNNISITEPSTYSYAQAREIDKADVKRPTIRVKGWRDTRTGATVVFIHKL